MAVADRTVTLTLDEIQALIEDLENTGHTVEDFEAECPTCTAHRKLKDAQAAASLPSSGGKEGER